MRVSSLFLRSRSWATLAVLSLMSSSAIAQSGYQLQAEFSGATFFNNFNFVTVGSSILYMFTYEIDADCDRVIQMVTSSSMPPFVFVRNLSDNYSYVDYTTAYDDGQIATYSTGTSLMPDSTTVLNPNGVGRDSVKIVSTQTWTHGLVITDLNNMPGGVCGVEARCELK